MRMLKILALLVYILFVFLDSHASEHEGNRFFKCFLMPLLILVLIMNGNRDYALYTSLIFCWAGDFFLIRKTSQRTLLGMLSFLCAHACYFIHFFHLHAISKADFLVPLCYALYGIVILKLLFPFVTSKKKAAIALYILTILAMSCAAFLKAYSLGGMQNWLAWSGTVFFVISDTMISWQMSHHQKQKGVMQTYGIAQLLIVLGVLL